MCWRWYASYSGKVGECGWFFSVLFFEMKKVLCKQIGIYTVYTAVGALCLLIFFCIFSCFYAHFIDSVNMTTVDGHIALTPHYPTILIGSSVINSYLLLFVRYVKKWLFQPNDIKSVSISKIFQKKLQVNSNRSHYILYITP